MRSRKAFQSPSYDDDEVGRIDRMRRRERGRESGKIARFVCFDNDSLKS